jgi:hypothetical protein
MQALYPPSHPAIALTAWECRAYVTHRALIGSGGVASARITTPHRHTNGTPAHAANGSGTTRTLAVSSLMGVWKRLMTNFSLSVFRRTSMTTANAPRPSDLISSY